MERRPLKFDKWFAAGEQFMRLSSCYPDTNKRWTRVWYLTIVSSNSLSVALLTISLYVYRRDLDKFANALHHWLLMIDILVLAVYYRKNSHVIQASIEETKTTFPYGDWFDQEIAEKLYSDRKDLNKKAIVGFWFLFVYTSINLFLFGLLEKYMEGTDAFMFFPCWVPFNLKDPFNYFFFITWQFISIQSAALCVFGILAAVYYPYCCIQFELNLLIAALGELRVIKRGVNARFAVNQCVAHHQSIIKFIKRGDKILHLVIFIILTSGVAVMTISGLAIISDNNSVRIKFFGIMLVELSFLYVSCRMSQNIRDASTQIKDACYDVEWTAMDRGTTRSLQIMVERSFKPLTFKSMTGHHLSLDVYMDMVKAAYSYFNMLLAQQ